MIQAQQVAEYLREHPEFFQEHADVLADLSLPHPHGTHAVSLGERQVLALREKNRLLERKLKEMVQFGEENDVTGERLHRLTLSMLAAGTAADLIETLYKQLREGFGIPHARLRLWPGANSHPDLPEFLPLSEESRLFAESLDLPRCAQQALLDTGAWFGAAGDSARSFAYVPLRAWQPIGLLCLASEDPQRFLPEAGTLYLQRLGELASVLLTRLL